MLDLILNTWQIHPVLVVINFLAIVSGVVTSINYYNKWHKLRKSSQASLNQMWMDASSAKKHQEIHVDKLNKEILRLQKEIKNNQTPKVNPEPKQPTVNK